MELQGMYPFVASIDDSLILEWAANDTDSAINEIPTGIQRRALLIDRWNLHMFAERHGRGRAGLNHAVR